MFHALIKAMFDDTYIPKFKGEIMKTLIVMTMAAAVALTSGFAAANDAANSKVIKSTIEVNSNNKNSLAQAIGDDSLASVGSVNIRNSRVDNSEIYVNSNNENAEAIAEGNNSTASVGSVTIE